MARSRPAPVVAIEPAHDPNLSLDDETAAAICAEVGASLRDAAVALHIWAAGMAGTMPQN